MNQPKVDCTTSTRFLLYSLTPVIEREINRVQNNLKRAQRKELAATLTLHQWLATLHIFRWRCAFCPGPFESMEHLTRLADGGGTTADNCVPCCLACNQKREQMVTREIHVRRLLTESS